MILVQSTPSSVTFFVNTQADFVDWEKAGKGARVTCVNEKALYEEIFAWQNAMDIHNLPLDNKVVIKQDGSIKLLTRDDKEEKVVPGRIIVQGPPDAEEKAEVAAPEEPVKTEILEEPVKTEILEEPVKAETPEEVAVDAILDEDLAPEEKDS